jgi:cytochrome c-type biogenesis protein CcmH/NrfG
LNGIEHLAEKLVQQNPTSLPHRTLLALARLEQHRPAAAIDVYSNIKVAPNTLSPSALVVHAAVLEANGHHDDAMTEAQIPRDKLLPEERDLIQGVTNGE